MKTRITVSIEQDLVKRLKGLAEFQRRSFSNMVEMYLERAIENEVIKREVNNGTQGTKQIRKN